MFLAETKEKVVVQLHRVPFFLEPEYNTLPANFTESHDTRMLRKFGSKEAFERFQTGHGLIPRGNAVGMNDSVGWNQENLSARVQSSTLNAHRLVLFVEQEYGWKSSEQLYAILSRRHFTENGILNNPQLLMDSVAELFGEDKVAIMACEKLLASSRGRQVVLDMAETVCALGVHSIPQLVIDGRVFVSPTAGTDHVLTAIKSAFRTGLVGSRGLPVPTF